MTNTFDYDEYLQGFKMCMSIFAYGTGHAEFVSFANVIKGEFDEKLDKSRHCHKCTVF